MAEHIPLKAIYDGSTLTGLGQFAATDTIPAAHLGGAVTGDGSITSIIALTQAEYNAIASPASTTLYVITDA